MKTKIILAVLTLLLTGCSDKPKINEDVDKLSKLSPAGQVASIMQDAAELLAIAAICFALNGGTLIKRVRINKTKSVKSPSGANREESK